MRPVPGPESSVMTAPTSCCNRGVMGAGISVTVEDCEVRGYLEGDGPDVRVCRCVMTKNATPQALWAWHMPRNAKLSAPDVR
jgi:hypothetical protein